MLELFWLLLPAAAASGWYTARHASDRMERRRERIFSGEYIRGLNYLLNEETDRALEVFVQMVDIDSETVETHLILGSLFRRRGEMDRAIRIHQNLIARPNLGTQQRASALMELGKDFLKAGVLDRAEGLFRQLAETGLNKADAYLYLRQIYEQEKEWKKAISAAGSYYSATGEDQSEFIAHYYCEMGEAAMRVSDTARAAEMAKKALSTRRGFLRASLLLGDMAAERGDYREAARLYAGVLEENPDMAALGLSRLREIYGRLGDVSGYEAALQRMRTRRHSAALTLEYMGHLAADGSRDRVLSIARDELARGNAPLPVIAACARIAVPAGGQEVREAMEVLADALERHVESVPAYHCDQCGFQARNHFWRCPGCHGWGTLRPFDSHPKPSDSTGATRA